MTDLPSPSTLAATALIDSDHADVIAFALQHAQGANDRERAVALSIKAVAASVEGEGRSVMSPMLSLIHI